MEIILKSLTIDNPPKSKRFFKETHRFFAHLTNMHMAVLAINSFLKNFPLEKEIIVNLLAICTVDN